ncbi:MAG: methylmalonyl-CoA mutase [Alphaproteobacteria bacterium]|jgi:methylmalonyl-CoA mutase|nr:methylmalonyl-CoA mutase [Alphaproteobacteria bacterium]
MANETLDFGGQFDAADEAQWREAVSKALKGGHPDKLVRRRPGGLEVRPLYRETDFPSSSDPNGLPGEAPYLRGGTAVRDRFLPWDIRQSFAHPDPAVTNDEILRDLERGVSSVELHIDPTGRAGVAVHDATTLDTALAGVMAQICPVALDPIDGPGTKAAGLLALWAERQDEPKAVRAAFNIDPLGALARTGLLEDGLDLSFRKAAALTETLSLRFPLASVLRVDARPVHEAGGSPAQELGALVAHGIDTLRRLDGFGVAPDLAASTMLFTLAVDGNYGVEIAKLRAARRLWARCVEALGLEPQPMQLQAVTSARMQTRYDPWVNMLRGTAAAFAGAVGGADIVTVRAFNAALGTPGELGRRVARNTQIIAMEESNLGRVADPAGGSWFTETLGEELAEAAWGEFQRIEGEGGYGACLVADSLQARVGAVRLERMKAVARRKDEITGVSAFPTLEEVEAPVTRPDFESRAEAVSPDALSQLVPVLAAREGEVEMAEPFFPIRLAEPFERLRDHAEKKTHQTGQRPAVFLATLGPLAEHTARADYARGFFAAGGIDAAEAPEVPADIAEMVAAFRASGCRLAVLCGADKRYGEEAASAAKALKEAGVQRLYLAGRPGEYEEAWRAAGIDSFIHVGVDVVAALELAHAELGIT